MAEKLNAGAVMPEFAVPMVGGGEAKIGGGGRWQMLVVYRGNHCPICKRYLGTLESLKDKYAEAGIEVLAVSADPREKAEDDIGFVLDQLDTINQEAGPVAGVLDLQRVGVMGFSKGGAAAGQFCVTDTRCKAGINLTGFMYGDIVDIDLQVPFFFINEEELWCPGCYPNNLFFKRTNNDAYQMKIRGARHTNFGDYPLYGGFLQSANKKPAIDVPRVIQIQNVYTLAFFDKHLKGMASTLLDGTSAEFPEVDFMSNHATP